jgi:hypothetical protein
MKRTRAVGPPPKGLSRKAEACQDDSGARAKLTIEPPATRDQGLVACLVNELIGRTKSPRARGLLVGGLDFRYCSRHQLSRRRNGFAGSGGAGRRQALGGSEGVSLSFMR